MVINDRNNVHKDPYEPIEWEVKSNIWVDDIKRGGD